MEPTEQIERDHFFVYNEEMPAGWQRGNMIFVKDPDSPGGVRHDMFIYDPKVKYEDRREGIDCRWIEGKLSCRQRRVIRYPWEEIPAEQYIEITGLFQEYRS